MVKYIKVVTALDNEHIMEHEFVVREHAHLIKESSRMKRNDVIECDSIFWSEFEDGSRIVVNAWVGDIDRQFSFRNVLSYEVNIDMSVDKKEKSNA